MSLCVWQFPTSNLLFLFSLSPLSFHIFTDCSHLFSILYNFFSITSSFRMRLAILSLWLSFSNSVVSTAHLNSFFTFVFILFVQFQRNLLVSVPTEQSKEEHVCVCVYTCICMYLWTHACTSIQNPLVTLHVKELKEAPKLCSQKNKRLTYFYPWEANQKFSFLIPI